MFNLQFYQDKKQALQQKSQSNLQKYINAGFDMVREADDIRERIDEIDKIIADNTKPKDNPKDIEPLKEVLKDFKEVAKEIKTKK
jgi:uncharacterized coiled-coil DUF342 family protein